MPSPTSEHTSEVLEEVITLCSSYWLPWSLGFEVWIPKDQCWHQPIRIIFFSHPGQSTTCQSPCGVSRCVAEKGHCCAQGCSCRKSESRCEEENYGNRRLDVEFQQFYQRITAFSIKRRAKKAIFSLRLTVNTGRDLISPLWLRPTELFSGHFSNYTEYNGKKIYCACDSRKEDVKHPCRIWWNGSSTFPKEPQKAPQPNRRGEERRQSPHTKGLSKRLSPRGCTDTEDSDTTGEN